MSDGVWGDPCDICNKRHHPYAADDTANCRDNLREQRDAAIARAEAAHVEQLRLSQDSSRVYELAESAIKRAEAAESEVNRCKDSIQILLDQCTRHFDNLQSAQSENARLRKVLMELVRLKDIAYAQGVAWEVRSHEHAKIIEDYRVNMPIAWQKAREALEPKP